MKLTIKNIKKFLIKKNVPSGYKTMKKNKMKQIFLYS